MFKRLFDIIVVIISLPLTIPLVILTYAIVLIRMGHPVIFIQERPGLEGRIFKMYKFRTMLIQNTNELEAPDRDRITSLGKFLRSTSLDELPELFNVLKGDMSLVGPRPLLIEYLKLYDSYQARRHEVRPGITGWAQVNGRNALSWDEKFKLDIWYVDNMSFLLDLKILSMTVKKVLKREDISAIGEVTMPRFEGTKQL